MSVFTHPPRAFLEPGMSITPFKLRVDWTVAQAYPGDAVVVELHRMDEGTVTLRRFPVEGDELTPAVVAALAWTQQWFAGRGFDWWCNIDLHQREDHTHITLHPRPSSRV